MTLQCGFVEVTFVCSAPVSWPLLIGHTVMHPSKETEGGPLYPFLFSSPHPGGPSWSTSTSPITFTSWWEGGSGSLPDLSFFSQLYPLNSAAENVWVPRGKWNYKSDLFNRFRFKKLGIVKESLSCIRHGRTWQNWKFVLLLDLKILRWNFKHASSNFSKNKWSVYSSCSFNRLNCFSYTVSNIWRFRQYLNAS